MTLTTPIPDLPKEVIEACNNNRLVLFLGAGLSCSAGLVNWNKLKEDLINELQPNGKDDLEELKKGLRGENDFYKCFGTALGYDPNTYNKVMQRSLTSNNQTNLKFHKLITNLKSLKPISIVTLNIDSLLADNNPYSTERAFREPGDCWPWELSENKIFFFHGKTDYRGERRNWVFSYNELKDRYDNKGDSTRFLHGLFSGYYVILFVGFSFSDGRLLGHADLPPVTLREIENGTRSAFHYALIPSDDPTVKNRLKQYGIKPLIYSVTAHQDPTIRYQNFERTLEKWGSTFGSTIKNSGTFGETAPEEGPTSNA